MPISVMIVHTDETCGERRMTVSFTDGFEGMRRCLGAAARAPHAEPDPKLRLRLLGAALIEALGQTPVREPHLCGRAVDRTEEAVMLAVKSLYEGEAARDA